MQHKNMHQKKIILPLEIVEQSVHKESKPIDLKMDSLDQRLLAKMLSDTNTKGLKILFEPFSGITL